MCVRAVQALEGEVTDPLSWSRRGPSELARAGSPTSVSLAVARLSWPDAVDASVDVAREDPSLRLFRDGDIVHDTTELSAVVTGLAPGEKHMFKVEAGDPAGNWSLNGPTTTVGGAPPPPRAPVLDLQRRHAGV